MNKDINIIKGKNIGETWMKYLNTVFNNCNQYFDGDNKIFEVENLVLEIEENSENDSILEKYADKHIIELYMKKMQTTEIVEELNASYGMRIFDQLGVDQYQWVLKRLRDKPETKAAAISLLLPDDPGPRIPCLDILDFKIRENILYTKAFFRSQNVLRAYGNLKSMFWVSTKLADDLGVRMGSMVIFVSNAHYEEYEAIKVKKLLEDYDNDQ